ncbi:MAG: ABC transporter permease [Bacilli bacterium]|nr:ABC transporter permease [Bacilli bacterium]
MSNKFWYLTKQSLRKKIKSKWFIGVNIMLALVIIALININSIIAFFGGDFSEKTKILVVDKTDISFDIFKQSMKEITKEEEDEKIVVKASNKTEKQLKKDLKDNEVAIVFDNDEENFVTAKVISKEKIDSSTYQYISQGLNSTKTSVALVKTNTDPTLLAKISSPMTTERIVLNDKKSVDENMEMVMGSLFPTLILPFFMLIIFLVQMIGGEICEEKTTKSMEIIISNVSPKVHLLSKVIASNLFIIIQGLLLVLYSVIGILISTKGHLSIDPNVDSLLTATVESGFLDKIITLLPAILIMMLLSFLAYSLIAGILAAMTTNMEDFNQIQTPIMLVLLAGYYLAIMAGMFDGSVLIRILSYVPFISCLVSPSLYIIGQISMIDVIISIIVLIITILVMIKYGLRVYKVGILNYSNEKIWSRFAKALKSKDV